MNVVAMGRSLVGKKFNSLRSPVRHAGIVFSTLLRIVDSCFFLFPAFYPIL